MLVKNLVAWAGAHFSHAPGDMIELPEHVARARIAIGLCADIGLDGDQGDSASLVNVPSLESRSPEYASLVARIEALHEEEGKLLASVAAAKVVVVAPGVDELKQRRVKAILDKTSISEPAASARVDITPLQQRLDDVREAIGVLDAQRLTLRGEVSREICEELRGEHARLVEAMCESMVELHKRWVAYASLTSRINGRDIMWGHLRASHPLFLSDGPADSQGRLAMYLREAVENGFFDNERLPPALRSGAAGLLQKRPTPAMEKRDADRRVTAIGKAVGMIGKMGSRR